MGHIQILLSNPEKDLSALPKKYLLVDTNFLIDADASIIVETPDNNCTFYIYEYNEQAYLEQLLELVGGNKDE